MTPKGRATNSQRECDEHYSTVFLLYSFGGFLHIISVLDYGRPSISGSIRSIKMYSWAQCNVQKGLLCSGDVPCVTQEEQGFGPSTLSTYPLPIYLRYLLGAQFISNLGPGWTGSYHTKEGFQVSKREWDCKNRELARGAKQRDCTITCVSICIHVYNNCLNVVNNLNCV
jgi:hypothetical protein